MESQAQHFKKLVKISRDIRGEIGKIPISGLTQSSNPLIPISLVAHSRGYIVAIVREINISYSHGSYTACLVLIRRLIETLLIEVFEYNGMANIIKDAIGNYKSLDEIMNEYFKLSSWHIPRDVRRTLPEIKNQGDNATHNRMFVARQEDVDRLRPGIRVCIEALLRTSGLIR